MADQKISELTAITGADTAADDVFVIVDTSANQTKKITRAELNNAIERDDLDNVDINGGTIDGVTIGGSSAGAITGTTITGTSFVTSGNMTFGDNDKAIFGAGSDLQIYHDGSNSYITDSGTGDLIIASSVLTTTDINGGTIDGTAIGGSTPAAGSFTTLNTSGAVVFNDAGADVDFRVEGDTDANLLFVDAGNDRVGIGTGSPIDKLDIFGGKIRHTLAGGGVQVVLGNSLNAVGIGSVEANSDASLAFYTNTTTERMRLDSSGNLGLGATPSAWGSNWKSITVDFYGALSSIQSDASVNLSSNTFHNGANWVYRETGVPANLYKGGLGTHSWFTAPSGTAGNAISFTQAMTLDASGNLLVGSTTATGARLKVNPDANTGMEVLTGNTATNTRLFFRNAAASSVVPVEYQAASHLWFNAGGTQAMTLDASGRLGVGITNPSTLLHIYGTTNGDQYWDAGGTVRGYAQANTSNAYFAFGTTTNHATVFLSNATERARITSGGDLLVGTTSSEGPSRLSVVQSTNNQACVGMRHTLGAGEAFSRFINADNSAVIGSISNNGNTATAYNTSSDYRLKNTIAPMTGALAKVAALKPCTYKWNADGSDGEGFIAHELAEVVPQCVTGEKDAVDADGNPQYQGIDTSFLVATLTAAIQEQQAIIESLKSRLDAAGL